MPPKKSKVVVDETSNVDDVKPEKASRTSRSKKSTLVITSDVEPDSEFESENEHALTNGGYETDPETIIAPKPQKAPRVKKTDSEAVAKKAREPRKAKTVKEPEPEPEPVTKKTRETKKTKTVKEPEPEPVPEPKPETPTITNEVTEKPRTRGRPKKNPDMPPKKKESKKEIFASVEETEKEPMPHVDYTASETDEAEHKRVHHSIDQLKTESEQKIQQSLREVMKTVTVNNVMTSPKDSDELEMYDEEYINKLSLEELIKAYNDILKMFQTNESSVDILKIALQTIYASEMSTLNNNRKQLVMVLNDINMRITELSQQTALKA